MLRKEEEEGGGLIPDRASLLVVVVGLSRQNLRGHGKNLGGHSKHFVMGVWGAFGVPGACGGALASNRLG